MPQRITTDGDESGDVVYRSFVENGGTKLGVWLFDDLAEAKACVEEFIALKYDLDAGEWTQDSMSGNHYLDAGPDGFSAGVFVDEIKTDRGSALEAMRSRYEEDA